MSFCYKRKFTLALDIINLENILINFYNNSSKYVKKFAKFFYSCKKIQ